VGTYSDSAAAENRIAVPQKVTHRNTTEPSNFAPRCIHKGTGNEYLNKHVQRHATAAPFTVAESWRPQLVPINRGMDNRVWYAHTTEYYSAVTGGGF